MDYPSTTRAAALPPRVASAIFATVGLIDEELSTPVRLALAALEQDLPTQIGSPTARGQEVVTFHHHSLLRQRSAEFMAALSRRLQASLQGIRDPGAAMRMETAAGAPSSASWTLTEGDTEAPVMDGNAGEMAARCKHPLYLLGNRFGVLAAAPAFSAASLPIGPARLNAAVHDASQDVFGDGFPHWLVVDAVSKAIFQRYPQFLDNVNKMLDEAGILPGLTHIPVVRRARARPAAKPQQHENSSAAASGSVANTTTTTTPDAAGAPRATTTATPSAEGAGPVFANVHTGPGAGSAVATGTGATGAHASGATVASATPNTAKPPPPPRAPVGAHWFRQPELAPTKATTPTEQAAQTAPSTQTAPSLPANPLASPTFAQVQALLARVHGRAGKPEPQAGSDGEVAPHVIYNVMDSLPPMPTGGPGRPQSIRHLHDQLKAQLKASHGPQARLPREQSDSLEVLTMLYDALNRDIRATSQAVELLGRLQLPLVRMALQNQEFFTEPSHPGRQLVSTVAESGSALADEADVDPRFDTAVKKAVERVELEYRGDEAVLHEINDELQTAYQEHGERSEAAEFHQVEAARGRERLTMTHASVHEMLDQRLAGLKINRYLDMLIRTAWHDALTFVRLRNDEHSDNWKRMVRLTDRMLQVACSPDEVDDVDLRESVTVALRRTGYHNEEAEAVGRALSRSASVPREESRIPMTELAVLIKSRPRFGETTRAAEEIGHMPQPRSRKEEECFQYLRTLPFGTWLEFVLNQQGELRRRRLSWYSQVTGNALLVNRRGARVAEMQLDQLARLMAANQVRVVKQDDISLMDRAWRATVSTLESFGQLFAGKPKAALT